MNRERRPNPQRAGYPQRKNRRDNAPSFETQWKEFQQTVFARTKPNDLAEAEPVEHRLDERE